MRLISTADLSLHEFLGEKIPSYAILSHTWGEEEVSYKQFKKLQDRHLAGYEKIEKCCAIALEKGLQYAWVDTCCIDKSSSAELTEAINSMYEWYRRAKICYAYIFDLESAYYPNLEGWSRERKTHYEFDVESLRACRWFTRGWTLQELLAPAFVDFYDQNWVRIGTRFSLSNLLVEVTKIPETFLLSPGGASVAQRFSWAANRKTLRTEDMAYVF